MVFDLNTKVDKVAGKGLSTNDFTDAEQEKVNGAMQTPVVDSRTSASVSITLANNTEYRLTGITSLTLVGGAVNCYGFITFGATAPTASVSGFTKVDGDDITGAGANEQWEFNVLNGYAIFKKWE